MQAQPSLMLHSITVQNFATFENQEVAFCSGFNSIIGETGSGKSLILDSIQLLLGQRADKKLIRKGSDFATVEGTFVYNSDEIKSFLDELGYPVENNEIVIKRVIYASGSSKSFINFQACPLNVLALFTRKFIDLVGQFENQKLLSHDYQLDLLDLFSKNKPLLDEYKESFLRYKNLKEEILKLEELKSEQAQKEEFIRFQLRDFEDLNPSKKHEEELILQKERLLDADHRKEVLGKANASLSESDDNFLHSFGSIIKDYESLQRPKENTLHKMYEVQNILEDLSFDLSKELEGVEEGENLDDVLEVLDKYQKLKRRFHVKSTEELILKWEELRGELDELENVDSRLTEYKKEVNALESLLNDKALKLHKAREEKAAKLSKLLTSFIRKLKMDGARIDVRVEKDDEYHNKGLSHVAIFGEINPGEGLYRIKDIASGGELSRILLAIRNIIAGTDSISIFLFDEIDTGIGGETALSIGKALAEVAQRSQVIAITHLPQIASQSDQLIEVKKDFRKTKGKETRTISNIHIHSKDQNSQVIKKMSPLTQ